MTLVSKGLEEAFCSTCKDISGNGSNVMTRGSLCKEIIAKQVVISDPTDIHIVKKERRFNFVYAISEFMWYLSCSTDACNIEKMAKIWSELKDADGKVVSNYGFQIRQQWDRAVNELIKDNHSRRAVMVINTPLNNASNALDCPCTMFVQFLIRDGQLNLIVSMRSNDVVFGFCNDAFCWCLFQQMMLNELLFRGLTLRLGRYVHNAVSMHVYERHFGMLEACCNFKDEKRGRVKLKDHFTWKYAEVVGACMAIENLSKEEIVVRAVSFFNREVELEHP